MQNTASGTASFVDTRTTDSPSAVAGTVQQTITETNRNWYVAVPVSGLTNTDITLSGAKIVQRNEAFSRWDDVTGYLTAGVGYIAVASAISGSTTWSLTGNLNSGKVQVGVTQSGATSTGFNLLGNPYPSYLNWEKVLNLDVTNASLLQSSIWYRTATFNSGTSKFDYTFNTYNSTGRISTPSSTTGYIPPMQAFWVRANNAGTVTFTNAMRSHGDGASNLLKAPKVSTQKIIRFQVSNNLNNTDETVLYFDENAQNSFDSYDSPKFADAISVLQIYTTAGTEKLTINGMNNIPLDTPIGLGFIPDLATSFSIKANEITNLPSDVKVILKDNVSLVETDLTDGVSTYDFIPAETTTDRFSIILRAPGTTTSVNETEKMKAQVFVNVTNQITIVAPEKSNYAIYNALGQILNEGLTSSNKTIINNKFMQGIYVVKVSNNGKNYTSRVIIK